MRAAMIAVLFLGAWACGPKTPPFANDGPPVPRASPPAAAADAGAPLRKD